MKLVPHITFNGSCEDAINFYRDAIGGEIEFAMRYSESPMADKVPAEHGSRIMHSTFTADGVHFMAADAMPGHERSQSGNIDLSIDFDSAEEQERVFAALSDGGTVQLPLQEMFWGSQFGMVTDRFGISWMLNRPLDQ